MDDRKRRTVVVPVLMVYVGWASACGLATEPQYDEPALKTGRLEYEVERTEHEIQVTIAWIYTNRSGKTVYVVNCNRNFPPILDKRVEGRWVTAWSPWIPDCLSPPVVILPGGSYADTSRVTSGPDSRFGEGPVAGTYRLRWYDLVHDYHDYNPVDGWGDAIPEKGRISNEFVLKAPGS